jgi:uncharacterized protein YjeT (DUF2065 family)
VIGAVLAYPTNDWYQHVEAQQASTTSDVVFLAIGLVIVIEGVAWGVTKLRQVLARSNQAQTDRRFREITRDLDA